MLKSIYVDGLRSLCDFRMELQPGLNVLIGPNGSGKTNILTAFELISGLIQKEPFVNNTGLMIPDLFDVRRKNRNIKLAVNGTTTSEARGFESDQGSYSDLVEARYTFECEVELDKSNELVFLRQFLEIETDTLVEGDETKRICLEFENNDLNLRAISEGLINDRMPTTDYESYFSFKSKNLQRVSLMREFNQEILPMESIIQDIITENFYRIDPNLVRTKMEEPSNYAISSTGKGLLTTLLDIFNKFESNENDVMSNDLSYSDIYKKIVGYFKLLIPELDDLEVNFNSDGKEIESYAIFKKNGGKTDKIPLRSMSDGTLKWLSVITALLTSKRIFLLEEPENYIHPALQQEFINLARTMMEHVQSIAVISTHSESILNSLDTSELIVTDFQSGRTLASRIANAEQLNAMLQEADFGLGWYYVTGSLDIDPETQVSGTNLEEV